MAAKNRWMRCARQLSRLSQPPAGLRANAVHVLLWLCSEGAPAPHTVRVGVGGRTVAFGWAQGGAVVGVEFVGTGRAVWRSSDGGKAVQSGRLGPDAVHALRSLIPVTRRAARRSSSRQFKGEAG